MEKMEKLLKEATLDPEDVPTTNATQDTGSLIEVSKGAQETVSFPHRPSRPHKSLVKMQDQKVVRRDETRSTPSPTAHPTFDFTAYTDEAAMFVIEEGNKGGQIIYMGYDFEAPHPEWAAVLNRAIREHMLATQKP